MVQYLQKYSLLILILSVLLFSGCQEKQIVIRASIPKEVAIAKTINVRNNNEVSTKGVEAILTPLVSGVSDSYFKNRFITKRNCIEYQIIIYKENKNDYFLIDCLDGKLIIEKKEKNNG